MEGSPASPQRVMRGTEQHSDSPPLEQNSEVLLSLPPFPPPCEVTVADRRLWEFWPGNNRFCLSGRVMTGPASDLPYVLSAWGLFLGSSLVYFVSVLPYLWTDVTPVLPALNVFLFLCTALFMLLCSLVEPGIIPRRCIFDLNGHLPEHFTENVISRDLEDGVRYKYCKTCRIFRPPRAHHCRMCGNCVEMFDHHCPFVNNCIGKRNYKYFVSFILSAVLSGGGMLVGVFLFFLLDPERDMKEGNVLPHETAIIAILVALAVLTAVGTVLISILLFFHVSLICSGETTKEKIRHLESQKTAYYWWRPYFSWFDPRQILTVTQVERATQWRESELRE